ncbi:MAG TPA: TonB-dependent receptor [Caulobacteraceae bacterium]|nr:TonB-dependent receptor [Caulobacteraceae bacterium]
MVLGLTLSAAPAWAGAETTAPADDDLRNLSLEQLADVQVTSVSKRPEALLDAPAAVYVITADDIRRAGVTRLPEALRLAPNLEVARVNASEYAISARGSNSLEASNKLLVLIDGRSLYSPVGSQVYWDQVNVPLADIDRIEVISGPGGTLYGVNAVNGVINIITKSASETQGALITAGAGDFQQAVNAQIGGKLGADGNFRVYAMTFKRDGLPKFAGDATSDAYTGTQGGFRIDESRGHDAFTLQGDIYHNSLDGDGENGVTDLSGGNIVGRWTHDYGAGAVGEVQVYYDQTDRIGSGESDILKTYDIQGQHNFNVNDANKIVWGGEMRVWSEDFQTGPGFGFPNPRATIVLGDAFAQDEMILTPDLKATLGLKLEDNSFSGFDWLPDARLAWTPDDKNLLWVAVSRAVRTPNRIERELQALPILAPSPDFASEKLWAYEAGWRGNPTHKLTLSLSAYFNDYDDLRTDSLTNNGLPIVLRNGLHGNVYGLDAWGEYEIASWWRVKGGFSTLHRDMQLKPGYNDITLEQAAGYDPNYQFQLRSAFNLSPRFEFDADLRRVDRLKNATNQLILAPAYTEMDARLAYRFNNNSEIALNGHNLLNPHHLEINDSSTVPLRTVPRTFFISLKQSF